MLHELSISECSVVANKPIGTHVC